MQTWRIPGIICRTSGVMCRYVVYLEDNMLLWYDCHKNHGQNTKSGDNFPPPFREGGVVKCMLSKSPGTPATTATSVEYYSSLRTWGESTERTLHRRWYVPTAKTRTGCDWDKQIGSKKTKSLSGSSPEPKGNFFFLETRVNASKEEMTWVWNVAAKRT